MSAADGASRYPQGVTEFLVQLAHDLDTLAKRYADSDSPVTGIRAVEPHPGERRYLCVREDRRVLCVDADGDEILDPEERHRIASAVLLMEHVEASIDGEECRLVATLAGRVTEADVDDPTRRSAQDLAETATALADWRLAPERAVARIAELDHVAALQSHAHVAHSTYLTVTEPLVAVQDTLDQALVEVLRDLENACGHAGIASSLSGTFSQIMDAIDEDAATLLGGETSSE